MQISSVNAIDMPRYGIGMPISDRSHLTTYSLLNRKSDSSKSIAITASIKSSDDLLLLLEYNSMVALKIENQDKKETLPAFGETLGEIYGKNPIKNTYASSIEKLELDTSYDSYDNFQSNKQKTYGSRNPYNYSSSISSSTDLKSGNNKFSSNDNFAAKSQLDSAIDSFKAELDFLKSPSYKDSEHNRNRFRL
jgi:hypothetical protein